MYRRQFGSVLACWGLVATAGCLGSQSSAGSTTETNTPRQSTDTTTEAPSKSISVTERVEAGQTGLTRVVHVRDGGAVSIELTCPDGTTKSARGQLSAQEWRQLEHLILEIDLTALQSAYQCESECPSDIPSRQLTISVNERVAETRLEAGATPPESLTALLSQLTHVTGEIDTPSCTRDK